MSSAARYNEVQHRFALTGIDIHPDDFHKMPVGKRIPLYRQFKIFKQKARYQKIFFNVGKMQETLTDFVKKNNVGQFYFTRTVSLHSKYSSDTSVDFFYTVVPTDNNVQLDLEKK